MTQIEINKKKIRKIKYLQTCVSKMTVFYFRWQKGTDQVFCIAV